eukprot:4149294-Prymnesium_polylepis.1
MCGVHVGSADEHARHGRMNRSRRSGASLLAAQSAAPFGTLLVIKDLTRAVKRQRRTLVGQRAMGRENYAPRACSTRRSTCEDVGVDGCRGPVRL